MSFLLDALRKSEDEKRRGAVPSIHGDEAPDRSRRPPRPLLYGLLIVLPLLLVLAWFLFRGNELPEAPAQVASAQGQPATQPDAQPDPGQRNADGTASLPITRPSLDTARTPVEQYQPEPQPASSSSGSGGAQDRSLPARTPETVSREDAGPAAGDPVQLDPPQPQSEPPMKDDFKAPMPGLITYWELPGSVRNDIMEMHISVMVFADAPEDRFILMNGRRWAEGDEPQSGLRIEEIRREGVVFTFRRYRFLLTQ